MLLATINLFELSWVDLIANHMALIKMQEGMWSITVAFLPSSFGIQHHTAETLSVHQWPNHGHYRDVTWTLWRFKSLATRLFIQIFGQAASIKENFKAPLQGIIRFGNMLYIHADGYVSVMHPQTNLFHFRSTHICWHFVLAIFHVLWGFKSTDHVTWSASVYLNALLRP